MARRVTEQDIIDMNEAYLLCGTYSGVAKALGWSASTVKKYIIDGYQSKGAVGEIPSTKIFIEPAAIDEAMDYLVNHSSLSCLTEQEKKDMKDIWKGMLL